MNSDNEEQEPVIDEDCAVCLQKLEHPTQLPCSHIFCFLCVKGIAKQSRKCAMCRAEIPPDYLDNPVILEKLEMSVPDGPDVEGSYQWYYEGRNGWWKYDHRSNVDLEAAYNDKRADCTLLIAGQLYVIDLQNMVQLRRSDTTKRRRVRRDTTALPAKGIAGIKIFKDETKCDSEDTNHADDSSTRAVIEILDESTTSNENSSSDVQNITDGVVERMRTIILNEPDHPVEQSGDT
ncbi:E3 ubiquitin-protein ligase RNF146-B isoform X2 [Amyelois transitella]|uniref:E3 ubiquitin-protein ligase RNF146-B isoform X2 n=1 Tax=Amyelois transitella TaxID=680683 RepID=UPI00067BD810|nr:E3 ubiquitin-protein ligase RNF146-B isoform X2 [Amyelois transitella]